MKVFVTWFTSLDSFKVHVQIFPFVVFYLILSHIIQKILIPNLEQKSLQWLFTCPICWSFVKKKKKSEKDKYLNSLPSISYFFLPILRTAKLCENKNNNNNNKNQHQLHSNNQSVNSILYPPWCIIKWWIQCLWSYKILRSMWCSRKMQESKVVSLSPLWPGRSVVDLGKPFNLTCFVDQSDIYFGSCLQCRGISQSNCWVAPVWSLAPISCIKATWFWEFPMVAS